MATLMNGLLKRREEDFQTIKCMVDAVPALVKEDAVEIFEKHGVYTKAEMESRAEVMYETYAKTINIEALNHDRYGKETDCSCNN